MKRGHTTALFWAFVAAALLGSATATDGFEFRQLTEPLAHTEFPGDSLCAEVNDQHEVWMAFDMRVALWKDLSRPLSGASLKTWRIPTLYTPWLGALQVVYLKQLSESRLRLVLKEAVAESGQLIYAPNLWIAEFSFTPSAAELTLETTPFRVQDTLGNSLGVVWPGCVHADPEGEMLYIFSVYRVSNVGQFYAAVSRVSLQPLAFLDSQPVHIGSSIPANFRMHADWENGYLIAHYDTLGGHPGRLLLFQASNLMHLGTKETTTWSMTEHDSEASAIDTKAQVVYVTSKNHLFRISYAGGAFGHTQAMYSLSTAPLRNVLMHPELFYVYITGTTTAELNGGRTWMVDAFNFTVNRMVEWGITWTSQRTVCGIVDRNWNYAYLMTREGLVRIDFSFDLCPPDPPGHLFNGTVHQPCRPCNPGYMTGFIELANGDPRRSCLKCPAGRYSNTHSSAVCHECPRGTFAEQAGMSTCQGCAGLAFWSEEARECVCDVGAQPAGGNVCVRCPKGTAKATVGNKPCTPCPLRAIVNDLQTACYCADGTYLKSNTSCVDCPEGGLCFNNTLTTAPGYWRPQAAVGNGDNDEMYECFPKAACAGYDQCAPGYQGFLCGECAEGYAPSGSLKECVPCDKPNGVLIIIGLVVCFASSIFFFSRPSTPRTTTAALVMLVHYMQLLSEVDMDYGYLMRELGIAQLHFFSLSPSSCWFPGSFLSLWLFNLFSPLLSLGALAIVYFVAIGIDRMRGIQVDRKPALARAAICLAMLLYIGCSKIAFTMLACDTIAGRSSLVIRPGIECWTGDHIPGVVVAVLFMILFVLGVPALVATLIFKKDLLPKWFPEVNTAFLVGHYKPKYHYWELLSLLRRLLFAIVVVVISTQPIYRAWVLVVTCYVSLWLHSYSRPYTEERYNQLEEVALNALMLSFMLESLAHAEPDSDLGGSIVLTFANAIVIILFLYRIGEALFEKISSLRSGTNSATTSPRSSAIELQKDSTDTSPASPLSPSSAAVLYAQQPQPLPEPEVATAADQAVVMESPNMSEDEAKADAVAAAAPVVVQEPKSPRRLPPPPRVPPIRRP